MIRFGVGSETGNRPCGFLNRDHGKMGRTGSGKDRFRRRAECSGKRCARRAVRRGRGQFFESTGGFVTMSMTVTGLRHSFLHTRRRMYR